MSPVPHPHPRSWAQACTPVFTMCTYRIRNNAICTYVSCLPVTMRSLEGSEKHLTVTFRWVLVPWETATCVDHEPGLRAKLGHLNSHPSLLLPS